MMSYWQYKKIEDNFVRSIAAKIYAHETWRSSNAECGVCANLSGANLSGANLSGANLSGANLSGADLDYAQWPLWCGSLKAKIDKRIAAQLFYHSCRAAQSVDDEEVRDAIAGCAKLANKFHQTGCERIK